MDKIIHSFSDLVWSDALIYLCLITGLYFSIRTGFLQVTYLKDMVRLLFSKNESDKGISSFQAFSLAISGRVGTGNIVGVATAIAMGGPGAVFWMWLIAFLGSASAFVEATLGQLYKQESNGEYRGGAAYYIEKGLGVKWYAVLFAVLTIISTGLLLPGVQSNSIASAVNNSFSIGTEHYNFPLIGELPVNYVGILIIVLNIKEVPSVFKLIFSSAFNMNATFSGIFGMAIAWGVKRGIYSNEAGQGTAPHAAAAAEVKHPAQQGLVQAFSVYIDTLFVCSATAFIILFTGQYNVLGPNDTYLVQNVPGIDYTGFTQAAVSHVFPGIGKQFVAFALFFFAFTTIMAYYYYAETNISYLIKSGNKKTYIWILRVIFLFAAYFGTVKEAKIAWALGDLGVGLMAWVNIIAILLLGNVTLKVWKDYKLKKKSGNMYFNSKEAGIKNADFWEK
ncbi:sodium:alanine symporter [Elizabethkingia anophelis]|nr:sodium:alanine symporter [Elizabethkingia anophelis]